MEPVFLSAEALQQRMNAGSLKGQYWFEHLGGRWHSLTVSWTRDETRHLLEFAPMRSSDGGTEGGSGAEICVDGVWLTISHTSLLDDVGCLLTTLSQDLTVTREFLLAKVAYGARAKVFRHGMFFSIIDSTTDG